jgi:hypothetical protein
LRALSEINEQAPSGGLFAIVSNTFDEFARLFGGEAVFFGYDAAFADALPSTCAMLPVQSTCDTQR